MTAQKKKLKVDVISDCVCPWCYVGKRHLDEAMAKVAERYEVEVEWHPFQLSPETPVGGRDWKEYVEERFGSMDRMVQMHGRLREVGQRAGIDFAFEKIERAANTRDAHRLIWMAGQAGLQDAVVEGLFAAYFTAGGDLNSHELLAEVAAEAGMDGAKVRERLRAGDGEEAVRYGLVEARQAGVTGVPFFIVEGKFALSGAQPVETMIEVMDRAAAEKAE